MANFLPTMLLRRLTGMQLAGGSDRAAAAATATAPSAAGERPFQPTPIDIVVVRIMLTRSRSLPPDLVDSIFDFAEYWAHSSTEINETIRVSGGDAAMENRFLLRSHPLGLTSLDGGEDYSTDSPQPLPLGEEYDAKFFAKLARYPTPILAKPARKIVFSIRSRDQGWGGDSDTVEGTYQRSWTWFEAGLERFDAHHDRSESCKNEAPEHTPPLSVDGLRPLHPSIEQKDPTQDEYSYNHPLLHQHRWEIQRNKVVFSEWQDHVVTWSYLDNIEPDLEGGQALDEQGRGRATGDGSFVRNLKLGDVITVWGKARFGGWVNHIESVRIDVYWAV